jgi:flavin-dependent dehydrogenase
MPPATDGVAGTYAPRRTVLDKILLDAAARSGAEVREGFRVDEVVSERGRVVGIRGRDRRGASVSERGRIVVGADGMRSLVARAVAAPTYNSVPPLTCAYYSYWSGVPVQEAEVYVREGRAIFAFPTTDELTLVFVEWPIDEFQHVRCDLAASFMEAVALAPHLADRMADGTREERIVGTAALPNFFRTAYGPGWALVGDAGYHKDPYLAQGMNDAFRDATLLAEALDDGLSGRRPLDAALADYARRRDDAAMPAYELNLGFATLAPPDPAMEQLIAALATNQDAANRFTGALLGVVPVADFFEPQNLEAILDEAGNGRTDDTPALLG